MRQMRAVLAKSRRRCGTRCDDCHPDARQDFAGLGSYLLTGKDRVDPSHRVGWIKYRNLPTARLDVAIRIMAGTASLSATKQPVYQLPLPRGGGRERALHRKSMQGLRLS